MSLLPQLSKLFPCLLVGLVPVVFISGATAQAGILLNEVNIDPPGSDDVAALEYVELISTTGGVESTDGLALLVVDSNNGGYGKIRHRWSLNGMATGENGLLLLGNGYPASVPYLDVPVATVLGDPATPDPMNNGDLGSNGGFTLFLVAGFNPATPLDTDLDDDDDGRLDFAAWTQLLDSVGFDDTDPADPPNRQTYAPADLSQPGFFPENVSRTAGDVRANDAAAWFGGVFPDTGLGYDPARMFGGFPGAGATPGRPNSPPQLADLRLNEISINPNGNDENLEFIEIASVSGDSVPTDGYHVVLLVNDPTEGDPGWVEQAWPLTGLRTGENGLLLLGDGYAKTNSARRADTPFKALVEIETAAGDPDGFGRNEIEPSNGVSILLVSGFSGSSGTDLDGNNDGTLDSQPWDAVVDSIGFDNRNEFTGAVTASYAPATLTMTASFYPDNLSRVDGRMDANDSTAWYGGDYGGDSQASIAFGENRFLPDGVAIDKPRATPGARNLSPDSPAYVRNVLINEVYVDAPLSPSNSDDYTQEFVELVSVERRAEVLEGLALLVVDSEPGSSQFGVIRQVFNLFGLSTGPNGLCVIGDSYNDLLITAPVPFDTNREDPQGLNAGDISPNEGLTILLVEGFSGVINQDIDADDDGVFDARPWSALMDAVGFGGIADPEVAVLDPGFVPDTISRLPSSIGSAQPTDAAAWAGGELSGEVFAIDYGPRFFGPFRGAVTRGFANHAARPADAGSVLINEVVINPAGDTADTRAESVEILVTTLDARSLSGYALVLLDSNGGSVGDIMRIWDLSGFATGPNGLLLLGEGFKAGDMPFAIDVETAVAWPLAMKSGDVGADEAFSLLLVEGMRPTVNEQMDLDVSDNGALDSAPWTGIADSVGFREYDADLPGHVGVTYGAAALAPGFEPDALARIADPAHLNAGQVADWYGGELAGSTSYSFGYVPATVFGIAAPASATPGFHNLGGQLYDPDATDSDADGRTRLLEEALGTDPSTPDIGDPLSSGVIFENGTAYLSLTYPRLRGGTLVGNGDYLAGSILYSVESSADLRTWSALTASPSGAPTDGHIAEVEIATIRETSPLTHACRFLRLRVTRQ